MADDSYRGIVAALMGGIPEAQPQRAGLLGGLLGYARPAAQGMTGILGALTNNLGIPSGEVRNAQGHVVFPTNALERLMQGSDQTAQSYAAAFMGPAFKGRAYHGTGQAFDNFNLAAPKTTGGGLNDKGVFLTPDPHVASRYAEFTADAPAPNVRMHQVEMKQPLVMSASEFERMQDLANMLRRGQELPEVKAFFLQDDLAAAGVKWDGKSHPIDAIRSAGFDGIVKQRGKAGADPEYMVFDTKNILPP